MRWKDFFALTGWLMMTNSNTEIIDKNEEVVLTPACVDIDLSRAK